MKHTFKQFIFALFFGLFCMTNVSLIVAPSIGNALEPRVVQTTNNLEFWTETFGDKNNPAIMLIMGSGGQGLLWPQQFCESLASKGFFVIRFDNRDTGLSSTIDYAKTPYNLQDMAKDNIAILDSYNIQKAHVLGASMGGSIAMIMGANYPDRVESLILMATSPDMSICFNAFQGKPANPGSTLSSPTPAVLEGAKKMLNPPQTLNEKVEMFVEAAKLNAGTLPIDETLCRQLALQSFVRMKNPMGVSNHFMAAESSYDLVTKAIANIKQPTLVLHGDSDPVFPIDHAKALNKAIPSSKLKVVPGMGHGALNISLFEPMIQDIQGAITVATVNKKA